MKWEKKTLDEIGKLIEEDSIDYYKIVSDVEAIL